MTDILKPTRERFAVKERDDSAIYFVLATRAPARIERI